MSELSSIFLLHTLNEHRKGVNARKDAEELRKQQRVQELIREEKEEKHRAEDRSRQEFRTTITPLKFDLLKFKNLMTFFEHTNDPRKYKEVFTFCSELQHECDKFASDINNFIYDQVKLLQERAKVLKDRWEPLQEQLHKEDEEKAETRRKEKEEYDRKRASGEIKPKGLKDYR